MPRIHADLSTERVLVMEYVEGVKVTHLDGLDGAIDRATVARALVAALIKQLLVDGFFHGDPHPGNVVLDPRSGRLTFLDLGLMGELRLPQRVDLMALVYALRVGDPGLLAMITRRLCRPTGPVDEEAFRAGIERIYQRSWRYGSGDVGGVMTAVFALLGEQNLRMRRDLVMAVKALTQAEELVRAVDPGLPMIDLVVDEGKGLVLDQLAQWRDRAADGDLAELLREAAGRGSAIARPVAPFVAGALGIDWPAAEPAPMPLVSSATIGTPGDEDRRVALATLLAGAGITVGLSMLAVSVAPVITDGLVAGALIVVLVVLTIMAVVARRWWATAGAA